MPVAALPQAEADQAELRAELVAYNLDAVDAAITALNEALATGGPLPPCRRLPAAVLPLPCSTLAAQCAQRAERAALPAAAAPLRHPPPPNPLTTGMDWQDLDRMIKEERRGGNPVAGLIHSLQLEQNKATLLLVNMLDDEDEGDEEANTRAATKVCGLLAGRWPCRPDRQTQPSPAIPSHPATLHRCLPRPGPAANHLTTPLAPPPLLCHLPSATGAGRLGAVGARQRRRPL
jgi:hypothetical protein